MFKLFKKGELRIVREDGSHARCGIRIKNNVISFLDRPTGIWYEYESGAPIEVRSGKSVVLHVEHIDE